MTKAHLIPPKEKRASSRERTLHALYGATIGTVVAVIAWLLTHEASWFYAVPIFALLGVWASDFRPNVLWGHRDP